jgi:ABC-2 type transport system permease protein
MGDGELDPETMGFMFLGYINWFFALGAISDLSYGVRAEMTAGTLEQMSMSPAPISLILLGRATASLLWNAIILILQTAALVMLLNIRFPMRWDGILVLLCTLIGTYGFGFVIAGATLIFKQFESFANLLQNVLLFLNGTLLPTASMPVWLAALALTLPTTQGVIVLRKVVLEGLSIRDTWQDNSLMWLVVHSCFYFVMGWAIFSYCERVAKRHGSLGQY